MAEKPGILEVRDNMIWDMINKQLLGSHAIVFPLAAFMREQLGFQMIHMIRKMNSMRARIERVFQLIAEAVVY